MAIIRSSPWQDAAQYGAGLGSGLAQAFAGMPQQRLQMGLQLGQLKQQQQAALMDYLLRKQQAQQQAQYQQGELANQQQELGLRNQQYQYEQKKAELELARMQKTLEAAQQKADADKQRASRSIIFDKTTGLPKGATVWGEDGSLKFVPVQGLPSGDGQTNMSASAVPASVQSARLHAIGQNLPNVLKALVMSGTNAPALPGYSDMTNFQHQAFQALTPQPMQGGLPSPQLPQMPQMGTNMAPKVFRYNPATGGLE